MLNRPHNWVLFWEWKCLWPEDVLPRVGEGVDSLEHVEGAEEEFEGWGRRVKVAACWMKLMFTCHSNVLQNNEVSTSHWHTGSSIHSFQVRSFSRLGNFLRVMIQNRFRRGGEHLHVHASALYE